MNTGSLTAEQLKRVLVGAVVIVGRATRGHYVTDVRPSPVSEGRIQIKVNGTWMHSDLSNIRLLLTRAQAHRRQEEIDARVLRQVLRLVHRIETLCTRGGI